MELEDRVKQIISWLIETGELPLFETYDDRGLTIDEYVELFIKVSDILAYDRELANY